jgi:threonine dehydrogenase-like Zn-dependent dehydrogenase
VRPTPSCASTPPPRAAPIITDGRIFGYEVVGTVVEVGADVHTVHVGDRLLVSCSSARGHSRSLLHRCRLVAEAGGQSSHETSSTPGWTRLPDDSARPSAAIRPPLAGSTAVRSAAS